MSLTPNQFTILEALKDGPGWMRSFQTVKPLVEDLVRRGLIERCRPHLGSARNMIRLTEAGCTIIEIEPTVVPSVRAAPKPNSKAYRPTIGKIKAEARPNVRKTCEDFLRALKTGATATQAVGELAAMHDVQRPAIWKRLRDGGVIAPYATRQDGGKGRPRGGGQPGFTERRRDKAMECAAKRQPVPSPEQFVDRDPCTFCGVRGDIGCSHRRRAA